jgi:ketosteroid isomerase-like protein
VACESCGFVFNRAFDAGRLQYGDQYDNTQLSSDVFREHVNGLVVGSWRLQRKDDQPHGKFTLLFRKLPEGWRIVLDHTS